MFAKLGEHQIVAVPARNALFLPWPPVLAVGSEEQARAKREELYIEIWVVAQDSGTPSDQTISVI